MARWPIYAIHEHGSTFKVSEYCVCTYSMPPGMHSLHYSSSSEITCLASSKEWTK